jgi:hypothetical protein
MIRRMTPFFFPASVDRVLDARGTAGLKGVPQEIQHPLPHGTIRVVPELEPHATVGDRIEFGDDFDVDLIIGRPVLGPQLDDPQLLHSTLRCDQLARHQLLPHVSNSR